MERKMAEIVKIDEVIAHPNADSLDLAKIGGWQCVVKRGEFKPGDLAVYIQIDAWTPYSVAPFLLKDREKEYNGVKGDRIRTIRLRGEISQGLVLPLSIINANSNTDDCLGPWEEGMDVSERLNIQKWEAPVSAQLAGTVKGNFPSWMPKTDEERIQGLTREYWDKFRFKTFTVQEKIDGSSCSMYWKDGVFGVCSRNLELSETEENTFWKMARKYDIANKIPQIAEFLGLKDISIRGEVYGESIQKNLYKIRGQKFAVFDIFDIVGYKNLPSDRVAEVCEKFGLDMVPVIGTFPIQTLESPGEDPIQSLIKYADGKSMLNPNTMREGVVFKCVDVPEWHFKSISNEFLLKYE